VTKLSNIPPEIVATDSLPMLIATASLLAIYAVILVAEGQTLVHAKSTSLAALLALLAGTIAVVTLSTPVAVLPLALTLAVGLVLSLISPYIGSNILLAILVLRPWDVCPPNPILGLAPKTFAGAALASWALDQLAGRRFNIALCTSLWLYVFWLGWLVLATLLRAASLEPIFSSFIPASAILFLLYNTPQHPKDLSLQRHVIMLSLLGVALTALYLTTTYSTLGGVGRLESLGFWANSNDIGALLAVAFGLSLSQAAFTNQAKAFYFCLAVTFALCAWFTQSRATLLAMALTVAVVANLKLPKEWAHVKLLIIVGLISVGGLATLLTSRDAGDLEGSSSSRKALIMAGLRMTKANPLLGVGFKRFPEEYNSYTDYYDDVGSLDAHNSWVLPMAETGLPGFVLFASFMLTVLQQCWQIRVKAPHYLPTATAYYLAMSFLSHTYLFLPYLLAGAILGAARVHSRQAREMQG
jgi:O-antigen ligase